METGGSANVGVAEAFVGVDVGGTHTDVQVVHGERQARGKALTTYDDFSVGVLNAIGAAAENLGVTRESLLGSTRLLVNATTVVTNVIAQLKGAKVGALVTSGFRDEFRMAGGPRLRHTDDHVQTNVPDILARRDIFEVEERIDALGRELVPLSEDDVLEAARVLVEERGVTGIAVCFLSSYANSVHEDRAAELIAQRYPDVFVIASSQASSVRGEYARWMTAVLSAFVHEDAMTFLRSMGQKLEDAGLAGEVVFFQGLGGGISRDRAAQNPLALLGAGPAGGAAGARDMARRLGHDRVLLGDMGGTSFDTGLVLDGGIQVEKNIRVGRFRTSLPLVDVVSVGAGGGSIAWVSDRGVPQVGPRSAGSTPGPAAYDFGGTEPTVTDAMVAMNLIDPENYLNGRVKLQPSLAERAIRSAIADPMGWTVEEAAVAIHDLVVANSANALHEVSVSRGHDPRDFVFYAYGGTLPWFAAEIARSLDISKVIIPHNSSVFCARGLLVSDFVIRQDRTVQSMLLGKEEIDRVNAVSAELVDLCRSMMEAEGFAADEIEIEHSGDLQFAGQVHALEMSLPARNLTEDDVPALQHQFLEVYERTYGKGTAWPVPPQILNYTVTARGRLPHPQTAVAERDPRSSEQMLKHRRKVFLPSERRHAEIPVYDEALFTHGSRIEGPALVESIDTTMLVPDGAAVERDELLNFVLTFAKEA
ncbi:hydantoinase/oxoprolinase family protein [Nocardioides sp. NPDC051685]|uniref:hydantoinase/oxoprolinase family protein n=1 Tax=Nocardioides sp. NPDC051685 TaxID=3364334 RepID=UPI0037BDEC93